MFKNFFFRRKRKYTKFDFYILLGILLFAVLYERPENSGLYLTILAITIACTIYIERCKLPQQTPQIINHTANVPKEFVKDKNTLGNIHCVAKYFPSQKKIIVMDHPDSRVKTELRSFEVSKENVGSVEKVWQDICSVFDEYTFFDTLFSYIDKNSGILKLNFIHRAEREKEHYDKVESHDFSQPEPVYNAEALVLSEYGDPLINIEKLDKKEANTAPNENDNYEDFVEMGDILKPEDGKTDVNIANAEKLSELPGINIVKAKKIVEYRNKNGFFKTKEDFYKVAGIKEHFKAKIEDIITVDKTSKAIVENPRKKINTERIVD